MILFIVWAFLNSLAWGYGSTAALPFTTVLFIVMLAALVYFPLTLIGGLTGRMRSKDVVPYLDDKYTKLPKEIPKILWYLFYKFTYINYFHKTGTNQSICIYFSLVCFPSGFLHFMKFTLIDKKK